MDGKASSSSSKEDIRRMMRQVAAKMSTKQPASQAATASSLSSSAVTAATSAAAAAAAGSQEGAAAESVKGHPFARYNSLNQLTCILCGCPVKSSLLWRAHLVSRQHRANADALKSQGADRAVEILSGAGLKRRLEDSAAQQQRGLGLAYSDDEDAEGDGPVDAKRPRRTEAAASASKSAAKSLGKPTGVARHRQPQQQPLPEGFFDDPVADARARHVPYRDKMEEELELFAREMRDAQAESEMMAEAAEGEADNVRYLEEIIAQEETWHRLNELELMKEAAAVKQEELQAAALALKREADPDQDEADDEADFDWRRKRL